MSEPTPLSAEERQRLESIHPMWSHQSGVRGHQPGEGCDVFPCLTNRALATIDAQAAAIAELQREIEGYRQAMELELCPAHSKHFATVGLSEPLSFKASCPLRCSVARRVLAGKEAQCPKCKGRGFIRTMVDGERDSEPCSFCRMSGLAGKEAQE